MDKKTYYAYGPSCCLGQSALSYEAVVKEAYQAGYGFVVRYHQREGNLFPWRQIIAWNCQVLGFEQALEQTADKHYVRALYEKGCHLFILAPFPDSQDADLFPFKDFDSILILSESDLNELLK